MSNHRRAGDKGIWCVVAHRFSLLWDFIDKRDIDKHLMAWATFYITIYLVDWTLDYIYQHPEKSGAELGMVVAAYMVPWNLTQAVVIKWYYESRPAVSQ